MASEAWQLVIPLLGRKELAALRLVSRSLDADVRLATPSLLVRFRKKLGKQPYALDLAVRFPHLAELTLDNLTNTPTHFRPLHITFPRTLRSLRVKEFGAFSERLIEGVPLACSVAIACHSLRGGLSGRLAPALKSLAISSALEDADHLQLGLHGALTELRVAVRKDSQYPWATHLSGLRVLALSGERDIPIEDPLRQLSCLGALRHLRLHRFKPGSLREVTALRRLTQLQVG